MIRQRIETLSTQPLRGFLDAPARQAVDNAGVVAMLVAEKAQQLRAGLVLKSDAIADVRAVEAGDEVPRLLQAQARGDFLPRARIRRGGERNPRHRGEAFVQGAQLQVILAKIVPPLRDAMGLVDGKQSGRNAVQQFEHTRLQQTLGGHVE